MPVICSGGDWSARAIACGVHALLALSVLGLLGAVEVLGSNGHDNEVQFAQTQPQGLPPAPPPIGPLRRGPDGQIEVIAPPSASGRKSTSSCSPKSICVGGPSGPRTLSDAMQIARDGAVIEIVGEVYRETVAIELNRVRIRGVAGRPHFNCRGLYSAEGQACLLLGGEDITLENLEISGAETMPELGRSGACIRNRSGRNFTVRGLICHDSQNGLLTDGGSVLIENSEFYNNSPTDQTHNVHLAGDCREATVRNSTFRDTRIGHEFKSRCRRTTITDSSFRSTSGSRNIDIPDGGETFIYNTLLSKSLGGANVEFVGFAAESCRFPASMHLRRVRVVNPHPRGAITNFDKCVGQPIILEEMTFEGFKPQLNGGVLLRGEATSRPAPLPEPERAPSRGPPGVAPHGDRPDVLVPAQRTNQLEPRLPRRAN